MLKILRKKGVAKKISWAIAIIIILSFAVFGTYLGKSQQHTVSAGKIFNHPVSLAEFDHASRQVEMLMMMRFGDKYSDLRPYLNLENEAWDRLILTYEADKQRIRVSDEDVIKTIQGYGFFQRDGQFDTLLYNDILKFALKMKVRDFEESVRDTLKIAKLLETQANPTQLTDVEILSEFKKQNDKVQISYALISNESFLTEVATSDEENKSYYENHKSDFTLPPEVNVEYVNLDYPKDAKDEDKAALRNKADSVYQQLFTNPNMKEIATKNDLTSQTSGMFSLDQPNTSLGWSFDVLNAIFQLKPNQITMPLETSKGFVIIKLLEGKDGFIPEFNQVQDKVISAVKKIKAKELAKAKAAETITQLTQEMDKTKIADFAKAGKSLGLELAQTPFFARGEYLPKIGTSTDFHNEAFSLTAEKKLSSPVEVENGVAILYLDAAQPADMNLFEKQKEQISNKMIEERKNESYNNYLSQLRLKAKLQSNLENLKK